MAAKKSPKYQGTANPQYARDMHAVRSSNAPGPMQDERDRRARTRGAKLSRALNDYR
jgi:hypothetical protein